MYASTLPGLNWLRRASILRLAWYRQMPASSFNMHNLVESTSRLFPQPHTSLVLIDLLIHLSTRPCHHHSHHPSLFHSFTPGAKFTFSTNASHLNRLLYPIALLSWYWDLTGPCTLISLLLVSHFYFLFIPCTCGYPSSFLLHVSSSSSSSVYLPWKQEALLSQRGCAMLRVCIASIQNVERSSCFGFRYTTAYN